MYRILLLTCILVFSSTMLQDIISFETSTSLNQKFNFAKLYHFNTKNAATVIPFWETALENNALIDTASLKQSNWYAQAIRQIQESEYEIKYDEVTNSYASHNRKNGLRSFYSGKTFTLLPRNDCNDKWKLELTTLGIYAGNKLIYKPSESASASPAGKNIRFVHDNNFTTEFINSEEGVRQNFIIQKEPVGKPETINLKLQSNRSWFINKVHNNEINFAKTTKRGYDKKITYSGLKVWDKNQKELKASFSVKQNCISIDVNAIGAAYPITIDPISTGTAGAPDWIGDDGDQANAAFAWSVASAGDVNGDGYSDVVIGATGHNDTYAAEGLVYVYYGSATGLSASPADILDDANQTQANFGWSVASAGDVNGDGYSDVIIGSPGYDDGANIDEGRAFLYLGSATGLSSIPNGTPDDADLANSRFGWSVACAGDVNGDGYSDVIVGAYQYDDGVNTDEGKVFVYHGSPSGLLTTPDRTYDDANQANAWFGISVASAGDVNGDGYSDILIGARNYDDGANLNEGRAFVYYGSSVGLSVSPNSILDDADQAGVLFGNSVASAGDVNGDGYSDVIIGAYQYTNGAFTNEGRAFVYYGSVSGISASPNWIADDANQVGAHFANCVTSAGDLNNDGYSDVIISAYQYNDGSNADEGVAYIYYGAASGLSAPISILDDANQVTAFFGYSAASAGDINGDGYSDVIVGAYRYDDGANSGEGRAFEYNGSPSGISASPNNTPDDADQVNASFGCSVASAGDVNGDGYNDVIIGAYEYDDGANTDEGRAFLYHGSATGLSATPNSTPDDANQANANFGRSVACAGDVNGDGYSDVIIGASGYDDGVNTNEGWAFVYYGSASGLSASPNNTLDDADQANANFGYCVSGAGDVNGDGYSDVIIGAWRYVDGANNQEGRAFVYHGSAGGLSLIPDNTPDDANQAFAWFGFSVAGAGDVNGDGFSDIIIGAYGFNDGANTQEGRAYIYYGSFSGLGSAPNNISDDADQAGAMFGWSVACAGDVNGDGFCDVIIGAPYYNDGINDDEGRAFVYYGSASGLSASPNSTPDDADQGLASFGISVASAGDVNGDGYSDVIIGTFLYDDGANSDEGRCFIYYGSSSGLSATPGDVQDDANQANSDFGYSVACAGDVNGDGYSDVIIGAYSYDDGATINEGRCFVYYGNNGGGLRHNLRLYNTDLITPIQRFNITEPNLFGTGVFAKSPLGRVKAKLVWEVKQQGQPFSGSPITNSNAFLGKQPSFTNLGIGGTELKYNVQKTGQQNKVRVRVEYDKATAITGQVYGPWSYPAAYVQGAHGMNSIPLPVGLNLFEAALIAGKVELQWSSGHDDNIKNYKVERSSNNRDFMAVRNISSLHQNNKTYYYQDADPLNGISWYRLAIINEQDQISYSKTIVIKNMNKSILIYPTILKNDENINLQFNKNIRGPLETQLVNIKGETVFKKYINTNWRRYTLDLPALPSGAYILTVGNKEDKIITQKIVIQ